MIEWIPTPGNGPSGRLPTEEDAESCGDNFRITFNQIDGDVVYGGWKRRHILDDRDRVSAWMPDEIPAPYAEPEPEKSPRAYYRWDSHGNDIEECIQKDGVLVDVFTGDPSIDGAIQVREEMRNLCEAGCMVDPVDLEKWLKLMEGSDDE